MKRIAFLMLACSLALASTAQTPSFPSVTIAPGEVYSTVTLDSTSSYGGTYLKTKKVGVAPYVVDSFVLPSGTKFANTAPHALSDTYQAGYPLTFSITTANYVADKKGLRYYLIKQK